MKRTTISVLVSTVVLSAGALFLAPAVANADTHWVINTTFTDGGTLTGFIDFNVSGYLGNYDLTTSAVGGFTGFEFKSGSGDIAGSFSGPGGVTVSLLGPTYRTDNLVLVASAPFTTSQTGNYLQVTSFECQGVFTCPADGVTRYLSGPSLLAVPEPATWALMIIGLGGVGAATRRRRTAVTA